MIIVMLVRPRGLWPSPEHGQAAAPEPVGKIQPETAQQNPPGIDFPSDAVPETTEVRQFSVNP